LQTFNDRSLKAVDSNEDYMSSVNQLAIMIIIIIIVIVVYGTILLNLGVKPLNSTISGLKSFLFTLLFCAPALSLASLDEDRAQLLNLSGCFLTDYNFAEKEKLHESYSEADFQKNSKRYDASAIEWIELVEDTGDRLLFQRIMIIDQGQTEPYVFKHHSEQWIYEQSFFYE